MKVVVMSLLGTFGHGAMSDFRPQRAQERTYIQRAVSTNSSARTQRRSADHHRA